jgi:hypothetical protein
MGFLISYIENTWKREKICKNQFIITGTGIFKATFTANLLNHIYCFFTQSISSHQYGSFLTWQFKFFVKFLGVPVPYFIPKPEQSENQAGPVCSGANKSSQRQSSGMRRGLL